MVCIRVSQEGFLGLVSCGSIHKLQVQSALQIPEDMLDCLPVDGSRVGVESGQHTNRVGDVKSGSDGQRDPTALSVTVHIEGERQSCIDGINTTIYYQKNSHNHMIG